MNMLVDLLSGAGQGIGDCSGGKFRQGCLHILSWQCWQILDLLLQPRHVKCLFARAFWRDQLQVGVL